MFWLLNLAIVAVVATIILPFTRVWPYITPNRGLRPMTEVLTVDLPYPREDVWRALWAESRFHGWIKSVDAARAGDILDYEAVALDGRWATVTRVEVRVLDIKPGRLFGQELLKQDGKPYLGGEGCWDARLLEDIPGGTRLTVGLHTTRRVPLQRFLMRKALGFGVSRLRRLLVAGPPPAAPVIEAR